MLKNIRYIIENINKIIKLYIVYNLSTFFQYAFDIQLKNIMPFGQKNSVLLTNSPQKHNPCKNNFSLILIT